MRAFVLSLLGPESQGNVYKTKILAKHGMFASVMQGINGKNILAADYFSSVQAYLKATNRLLTPSEVGCAASHVSIYKRVVEERVPFALVLEDDAIVTDKSCESMLRLVQNRLHEQGFVHLGGQDGLEDSVQGAYGRLVSADPDVWEVLPDDWGCVYRTVGYIISAEIAGRLIRVAEGGNYLADDFPYMFVRGGIRTMFLSNCVGHPIDLTHSSIEFERRAQQTNAASGRRLLARLSAELQKTTTYRIGQWQRTARARGWRQIDWR